jgi:hypothetical protein
MTTDHLEPPETLPAVRRAESNGETLPAVAAPVSLLPVPQMREVLAGDGWSYEYVRAGGVK